MRRSVVFGHRRAIRSLMEAVLKDQKVPTVAPKDIGTPNVQFRGVPITRQEAIDNLKRRLQKNVAK